MVVVTMNEAGYFQKGLTDWWNEESVYMLQRIEKWTAIARGYNRLKSHKLGSESLENEDDEEYQYRNAPKSPNETRRINCCGTFNYQSNSKLDSNCLETYRYDHSIYFKTIGDIRRSKSNENVDREEIDEEEEEETIEWDARMIKGSRNGGRVMTQNGGCIMARNGGRVMTSNGGCIMTQNGGRVMTPNGEWIMAQNGGHFVTQNGCRVMTQNGGRVLTQNGGQAVTQNGGSVDTQNGGQAITQNGGRVMTQNGGSVDTQNGGRAVTQNGGRVDTQNGGQAITQNGERVDTQNGEEAITQNGGRFDTQNGGQVVSPNGDVHWDYLDSDDLEIDRLIRNVWPIVDLSKFNDDKFNNNVAQKIVSSRNKCNRDDKTQELSFTRFLSFRRSRRSSKFVRHPKIFGDNNVSWPGVLLSYKQTNMDPALSASHNRMINVK